MPIEAAKAAITRDPVLVDLALQGGGSHGAFTWGVLDRLLEEPWLEIDGISGTSAGAMNAAVLVDGYAKGGAAGAREALETFWRRVSEAARFSPFRRGPLDVLLGRWTLDSSPIYVAMDLMSRLFSPYRSQSEGLQSVARDSGRSRRFRAAGAIADQTLHHRHQCSDRPRSRFQERRHYAGRSARLGLSADHVPGDRDRRRALLGRRLFRQSHDHARSSGSANRKIPFSIPINPIEREGAPRSASEILNRLNEVSFNAVVLKELRMMALLRQVADPGNGEGAQWAGMRIHRVRNDIMTELGASSKLNAEWAFFSYLRDEGRKSAQVFLETHAMDLGQRSTLDIDVLLEGI